MCNPPTSHVLPHQLVVFLKIKESAIKIVSLAAFRAPFAPKNIVDLLQRCIKVNNKSREIKKFQKYQSSENNKRIFVDLV